MENYYLAIVYITIMCMSVIVIHLFENETISRKVRMTMISIAILIVIGSVCEYMGIQLNNTSAELCIIHGFIKAIEFSVAPIIPFLYVKAIRGRYISEKIQIICKIVLVVNIACELISVFYPFVFYIDNINNVYYHGKYYVIYVVMYIFGIAFFMFELYQYTRMYQSRNSKTIISIMVFLISGFTIKNSTNGIYTDWLVVAIAYLMFIIYYSDLSLKVDPLTGVLNRKSYEQRIKRMDYETAIIMIDANDFKLVNDKYGHQCGDEILKIIAQTIKKVYCRYGYCYRIGGDEFCIILKPNVLKEVNKSSYNKFIEDLGHSLDDKIKQMSKEYPMLANGLSIGYSIYYEVYDNLEHSHFSTEKITEAITKADKMMYENKAKKKSNNSFQ